MQLCSQNKGSAVAARIYEWVMFFDTPAFNAAIHWPEAALDKMVRRDWWIFFFLRLDFFITRYDM